MFGHKQKTKLEYDKKNHRMSFLLKSYEASHKPNLQEFSLLCLPIITHSAIFYQGINSFLRQGGIMGEGLMDTITGLC